MFVLDVLHKSLKNTSYKLHILKAIKEYLIIYHTPPTFYCRWYVCFLQIATEMYATKTDFTQFFHKTIDV